VLADVLIYRTPGGLARGEGSELLLLDLPYRDLGALLADAGDRRRAMMRLREAPVRQRVPVSGTDPLAPVAAPGRLVLVGANYADHVAEAGMPTPEAPLFLLVPGTGLAGPMDDIRLPREAPSQVDYEGELAVVLAAGGSYIPVARGWEHIAGLTVVNDVSARDVQLSAMRDGTIRDVETLVRAKSFPTFKPLGPAVLMADDLAEQPDLLLQTFVNGQLRQKGRTSEMLFDLAEIIAYVSSRVELRVGDVILTGTPSGVGLADGHYLAAGDRVEVRVEGIGSLHNTVIA
jgi:2-keto-4-pentenoate hydratase/2-oxohepta-3-ene-1,7-dioic acid hydratase in catechol pathway